MIEFNAQLDPAALQRLLAMFPLTDAACQRAARRALRKAVRWVDSRVARDASNELRVTQKIIRARLRAYTREGGMQQKIWLGLNAVAAGRLGTPRQTASGVRVGRHAFPGAFVIPRFGGVYRRAGKERFPLEKVMFEIDGVGSAALRRAARAADTRLMELMRQELNYELARLEGKAA